MPYPEAYRQFISQWLGQEWELLADALAEPPVRAVRLHRVGVTTGGVTTSGGIPPDRERRNWLAIANPPLPCPEAVTSLLLQQVPWTTESFYISADSRLGKSIYHETGAYYLQEPSAMAVVEALSLALGDSVLDLCAAPGSKSTAIGKALRGTGRFVANEIHPSRVRTLAQNLERLGIPAVVSQETPDRLAEAWPAQFDKVLVDAPCSGEGMFRKDMDAVEMWTVDTPPVCATRQRDILAQAVKLVRQGGVLVYSTCTLNPIENEQTVAWFCANFPVELEELPIWPGWEPGRPDWGGDFPLLSRTRRLWPYKAHGEGHFVARFRVLESLIGDNLAKPSHSVKGRRKSPGKLSSHGQATQSFLDWLRSDVALDDVLPMPISMQGDVIFTDETDGLPLQGLKILRPGLALGVTEHKRFVPHHSLAMALTEKAVSSAHDLSPEEARKFLAGESIPVTSQTGWTWLHVHGLPLGWGKGTGSRINNLYPKGLRRHDLWTGSWPPS